MLRRRFWIALCLAIGLTATGILPCRADDEENARTSIPLEKHKAGSVHLKLPGVPADLYFIVGANYGVSPTPEQAARIKAGKLLWISPPPQAKKGKGAKKNAEAKANAEPTTTYLIQVPKNYDPSLPHGILVYVSAVDEAGLPGGYNGLLAKHHLIGVSAAENGNGQDVPIRHTRAVHAVQLVKERYTIDEDRIYVSGTSGGGRLSSQAMIMSADVFTGGLPMVGANPCLPMPNADSKGGTYDDPGVWRRPNPNLLRKAATTGRYAFLSTEGDFNQANVRLVAEGYKAKGFKFVTYLEEPGAKHATLGKEWFEKGLEFVDAPILTTASKDYEAAKRALTAKHPDQALLLFGKAAVRGGQAEFVADATQQAGELGKQYQEALDAAETAVRGDDARAADTALAKLRKDWLAVCKTDVDRLTKELKEARLKASQK